MADSAYAEGDTAFNPQTQEEAIFTGGKWVVKGSPQMPIPQGDDAARQKLLDEATEAQWLAKKASDFSNIQGGQGGQPSVQTGRFMREVGIPHIAENINPMRMIAETVDPRLKGMESISNQAWTHFRPSGSGPMRMPEIEGFQEGFPNVQNWGRENNLITQRLQSDAAFQTHQAQFIDHYLRSGSGTFADALEAWRQESQMPPPGPDGRPVPAPVDSSKPLPSGPQAGSVEGGYQFKGGNPADAANWIKVQ